jgi:hypothetical protein
MNDALYLFACSAWVSRPSRQVSRTSKVGRCTTTQPTAAFQTALDYSEDSSSFRNPELLNRIRTIHELIIAILLLQDERVHQSNQAVSSSFFDFMLTISGVCRIFLPEH